jgi:signal peptidase II
MHRVGLSVAAVVVVVDQLTKLWILGVIDAGAGVPVTGFFNLILTFNTGISFSLFQSPTWGPWVFSILSLAVVVGLAIWLRRAQTRWLAIALGGVIGGAVGNTVDRIVHGGVVDFLDLHVAGYHWPAFNAADSAIVGGVVMILVEGLIFRPPAPVDGDDHS